MSGNRPDEADSGRPQSEAEAAAARIAELVRRSNERRQQPAPASETDQPAAAQGEAADSRHADRPTTADQPAAGGTAVSRDQGPAAAAPAGGPATAAQAGGAAATPPATETERTAELPAVPSPPAYSQAEALPTRSSRADGRPGGGSPPRRPLPALLRDRRVVGGLVALGAVAVAVVVWLLAAGGDEPPAAKPKPSATVSVPGGYTVRASDTVTNCRANSRGKVQQAFADTPCRSAERYLATGVVAGRPVLYVVSRIRMPSASDAAAIKVVIDGTGTGNINDLLREGVTYPGAPSRMPRSGYASLQDGEVLVVAEAGFTDGGATSNTDPRLRAAAAAAAKHVVDLTR